MKASIIITTYNRANLLKPTLKSIFRQDFKDFEVVVVDDGNDDETPKLCAEYAGQNLNYIKTNRPKKNHFSNPSLPNNIGIRAAKGEVLIIQNAECEHVSPDVIEKLSSQAIGSTVVFAAVAGLTEIGTWGCWYTHSTKPRPFFFCGAISAYLMNQLGGFDEDYKYWGYDDDDMANRLVTIGANLVFDDSIRVNHLWHPPSSSVGTFITNEELFKMKKDLMANGYLSPVRNTNREWGKLCSV